MSETAHREVAPRRRTEGLDEALVLFETLADFQNQTSLAVPSHAERLALIRLHGVLEGSLNEPFRPDYQKLLEGARARLMEQFGKPQAQIWHTSV